VDTIARHIVPGAGLGTAAALAAASMAGGGGSVLSRFLFTAPIRLFIRIVLASLSLSLLLILSCFTSYLSSQEAERALLPPQGWRVALYPKVSAPLALNRYCNTTLLQPPPKTMT
jgi:hypothetical protein